ncbi:RNase A-like domain-containing protein [Kineococcus sp. SYSU DK005]|uniref:RNase A-like domain-containing protein n=1 Tax=Kineococcus sp. SYSU DK005 TaxID=3383126 RepID=UPI003D7E5C98
MGPATRQAPPPSPSAADAAAAAARGTAGDLAGARAGVDAAVRALGGWWGVAHDGFGALVAGALGDLDLLTRTAAAGAALLEEHARDLAVLAGRLRAVEDGLADAERRTRDPGADLIAFQGAWAALELWHRSREALLAEHDERSARLAGRLLALVADVEDRPRTLGEHVGDAVRALAAEGAGGAYALAGWTRDPEGWWDAARAAPGRALDALLDPAGTAAAALHLDEARDGRWGAVAGGLGAGLLGRGAGRAAEDLLPAPAPGAPRTRGGPDERSRGADGPLPPQSLDEMLAGVDLGRSEGPGHTLQRHVDVDDRYLRERLTLGTLDPGTGRRRGAPRAASRWADLATAERTVTAALRENEAEVRRALAGGGRIAVEVPVDASAGTVLVRDGPGFRRAPPHRAVVVLRRDAGGHPYVLTAYLDEEQPP